MPTPPKVDAILVCQHVHRDERSGVYTLVGIWNAIRISVPSSTFDGLGLYFNVTGLNGTYRFHVAVVAPDLVTELYAADVDPVVSRDPLERHELGFNVPAFDVPSAGSYSVRLSYAGRVAAEFTFRVSSASSTEEP